MTRLEVLDIPLSEMIQDLRKQLNLSVEEDKVFWYIYRDQLTQEEVASKVYMDIQKVKRIIKKIDFKISFVKKMY